MENIFHLVQCCQLTVQSLNGIPSESVFIQPSVAFAAQSPAQSGESRERTTSALHLNKSLVSWKN